MNSAIAYTFDLLSEVQNICVYKCDVVDHNCNDVQDETTVR